MDFHYPELLLTLLQLLKEYVFQTTYFSILIGFCTLFFFFVSIYSIRKSGIKTTRTHIAACVGLMLVFTFILWKGPNIWVNSFIEDVLAIQEVDDRPLMKNKTIVLTFRKNIPSSKEDSEALLSCSQTNHIVTHGGFYPVFTGDITIEFGNDGRILRIESALDTPWHSPTQIFNNGVMEAINNVRIQQKSALLLAEKTCDWLSKANALMNYTHDDPYLITRDNDARILLPGKVSVQGERTIRLKSEQVHKTIDSGADRYLISHASRNLIDEIPYAKNIQEIETIFKK